TKCFARCSRFLPTTTKLTQPVSLDSHAESGRKPGCVFSGQDSSNDCLHQAAGVAAAVSAHEAANCVARCVESSNRLFFRIQNFAMAIDQNSSHRKGDAGDYFQAVE